MANLRARLKAYRKTRVERERLWREVKQSAESAGLSPLAFLRQQRERGEEIPPDLADSPLVLAMSVYPGEEEPRFVSGVEGRRIQHQAGGVACNQHHLLVVPLNMTAIASRLVEALDKRYYDSCLYNYDLDLTQLLDYEKLLEEYGLSCSRCFRHFEEAVYPIDLTPESRLLLTADEVPDDPNAWLLPSPKRWWGGYGWCLMILTENSD